MQNRFETRPLDQTAKLFFIKASLIAPSSVTAQAAVIAEQCILHDLEPSELNNSLLKNRPLVRSIRDQAVKRHRLARIGPRKITILSTRYIIDTDFKRAEQLMDIPTDLLKMIYESLYPYSVKHRDNLTTEGYLVKKVQSVLGRSFL